MIIFDNFLDQKYLKQLQQNIPSLDWRLQSSKPDGELTFFECYTTHILYKKLFDKVCNLKEIKYNSITRWYINCNPSGKQHAGDWHRDDLDGSNITALFYPMPWNSRMYGGATAFKNSDEIVEYKENRLIIFDGNRLHRAVEHTSNFRYSIAFKLKAEWNEDSINN